MDQFCVYLGQYYEAIVEWYYPTKNSGLESYYRHSDTVSAKMSHLLQSCCIG